MSTQIQLTENKPTSQEIEQALINIIKAGLYYRRPKDGKFMQNYKERLAQTIFPNKDKYHQIMDDYKSYYGKDSKILNSIMELYKLYYRLAKDYFVIEAKIDEEAEDFLNS
ncbi:5516_t:CDS:2 [Rhizophagus irregularis]|nr:5516_t:CDS:2 [Rhizophagus irregularis]